MATQSSPVLQRRTTSTTTSSATLKTLRSTHSLTGGGSQMPLNPSSKTDLASPMPSIFGIMASRRLARQFMSRFRHTGKMVSPSEQSGKIGSQVKKEPTYRMTPKRTFNSSQVIKVIKEVVDDKLRGTTYDPTVCPLVSNSLSEDIKSHVKALKYDRYKIVCLVMIGQNHGQGLQMGSRCIWDVSVDNSATYTWQEQDMFCCVNVYGIYRE